MRLLVVLFAVLTASCTDPIPSSPPDGDIPPPDVPAVDPIVITSGDGITVISVTPVSDRTIDIQLSTPNIAEAATTHGNGIRVTLPPDYATSGKRYPVIFDLHGAGGGSFLTAWDATVLESIVSGDAADVIVVVPDGGKNGWYTDWLDQTIAQNWETYHLTQLVPFIDRNLRTLGTREGRGIMGISMGGFGATRYATDRPDLFGAMASRSGAIDLEHATIQTAVIAPSILFGLPVFGAYGPYFGPYWPTVNPVRRASRLGTVATFIYIGAGTDIAEVIVREATLSMHRALDAAAVPHVFEDYGVPGETPYGVCNGGHTYMCSVYAFAVGLPRVLGVLADPQ
ncbi:MAG: alpha/beta hydrolase-fold protein [Kofleriaceae bacterium]